MPKDKLVDLPDLARLDGDLNRLVAENDVVSLAMVDIDRFMDVNELYGREAGDRVLGTLAELLAEDAPGAAYRISGDEFAVTMPGATLEQAFLAMEHARGRIEASADRFGLPQDHKLTVTIGVAEYPRDAKDAQLLRQAVEAAMMSAKDMGKNRVGLPPNDDMVMKSSYYPASTLRRLKALAERLNRTESRLLREALNDLLRKYDRPSLPEPEPTGMN